MFEIELRKSKQRLALIFAKKSRLKFSTKTGREAARLCAVHADSRLSRSRASVRQAARPFQPSANVGRRLLLGKAPPPPSCQPWNHLCSSERRLLVESSAHVSRPVSPGEGRRAAAMLLDGAEAEAAVIGWLSDMAASCLTSRISSLPIHEQTGGGGQRSGGRSEAARCCANTFALGSTSIYFAAVDANEHQHFTAPLRRFSGLPRTITTTCTHLLVNMEPSNLTLCSTKVGTGIMEAFVRLK